MKAIDIQCQASTPWGSLIPSEMIVQLEKYLGKKIDTNKSDEEMAQILRDADVKAMIPLPTIFSSDIGEIRETNDRAAQFQKDHSDVVVGVWASISPNLRYKGLKELERCINELGFIGYYMMNMDCNPNFNDITFFNYYNLCGDAGVPVRLKIGHLAAGAGTPGGGGHHLERERPIPYIDDVAAAFPELTIISAGCPWPWHNDMVSILLHKGNVYAENQGTAPRYIPSEIKKEMNGRLQNKFMFASNFPLFSHDFLFTQWEAEGFKPEVLEKMYCTNAQKVFGIE